MLAQKFNCEYIEILAKTGENINKILELISKKILDGIHSNQIDISNEVISIIIIMKII